MAKLYLKRKVLSIGNSIYVSIPPEIQEMLKIEPGKFVKISIEQGKMVVEPHTEAGHQVLG